MSIPTEIRQLGRRMRTVLIIRVERPLAARVMNRLATNDERPRPYLYICECHWDATAPLPLMKTISAFTEMRGWTNFVS